MDRESEMDREAAGRMVLPLCSGAGFAFDGGS